MPMDKGCNYLLGTTSDSALVAIFQGSPALTPIADAECLSAYHEVAQSTVSVPDNARYW